MKEEKELNVHHNYGFSVIKVSNDGKLIATSDSNKNIIVLNSGTYDVVIENFNYHTSKVFALDFSASNNNLVSVSLDNSAIYWNISEKKKVRTFANVEHELVVSVSFYQDENSFVCGGYSCSPRIISINN